MAVFSWMSAPDISSDAAFRRWVQGVYDAFLGCGWVQTADTGQIADISAITVPGTLTTPVGYHVFAMDDDLQSECPVFVKIEYGRGSNLSGNVPVVWVTVGQSTDGSGTVGDVLFDRVQTSTTSSGGTSTEYPSYASCDGGGFALAMWSGYVSQSSWFFAVERSRDSAGSPTAEGILIALGCNSNSTVVVVGNGGGGGVDSAVSALLNVSMPHTINDAAMSNASTLSKDGVVAPVLPIPCMAPGVTPWVSNMLVAVHPGDAGTTSVIQAATINGQVRVYRAWTTFNASSGLIGTAQVSNSARFWPAIHWEVD